jgi:hypothetical protein
MNQDFLHSDVITIIISICYYYNQYHYKLALLSHTKNSASS